MEKESGITLSNSPTQQVGYKVQSKLNKVTHSIPLLSLDKTKSIDGVINFINRRPALLMLKYDGLTCELEYENGMLIRGSTRGDGKTGEDITHNVKTFVNLPLRIPYKGYLKIAGEAIILRNDFEKINSALVDEDKYKTPRNLASGSVRQLDNEICANRKVHFVLWDVLEGLDDVVLYNERFNKITQAVSYGFEEPRFWFITGDEDSERLSEKIEDLKRYAKENNIPIDGIVAKYDDIEYSKSLGSTSHHNNDGIAYKFEDETAKTVLRNIEWSMGKTGQLTPVAIFDSVNLDNTEVSRANLHNLSIIENLELGIGDVITVAKMNMIIPQIVKNITCSNNITIPNTCPICDSSTKIIKDNNSKILVCTNSNCKGKLLGKLTHFVSKPCMNIDGLSEATLEKFIEKGWIKDFRDVYYLSKHKDDIIKMDGFGKKSYLKLMENINKSKCVKLENFITALGIPNIGKSASKVISKAFNGDAVNFIKNCFYGYDFTRHKDFGLTMNKNLHEYIDDNLDIIDDLIHLFNFENINHELLNIDSLFKNKTVVVTGSLKNFTRSTIQEKLEEIGAKVSSSVSKKTDYLICGDNAGSKLTKAQSLNINIITEFDFLNMIKTMDTEGFIE